MESKESQERIVKVKKNVDAFLTKTSGKIAVWKVDFQEALVLLLTYAKVTNHIDWSWWWVTSPMWAPITIIIGLHVLISLVVIVVLLFGLLAAAIVAGVSSLRNRRKP